MRWAAGVWGSYYSLQVTVSENRDGHRMRRVGVAQLSEAQNQGRGYANPCGFNKSVVTTK